MTVADPCPGSGFRAYDLRWTPRTTGRCPVCDHRFEVCSDQSYLTPHHPTKKETP